MGPPRAAEQLALGRILGAFGTDGALRVQLLVEQPEPWLEAGEVMLGAAPETTDLRRARVLEVRPGRRGEVLMTLEDVRTPEQAEALRGTLLLVDADRLEPLPPGEFYCYQLVGCEVMGHQGERIGIVRRVWETGAHDVLVVEDAEGREVLLPAAEDLLREVDVEAGRIVIEVIPGLLDRA